MAAAYAYGVWSDNREAIPVAGRKIHVSDGDSFAIGNRKLRLQDIDAPELDQFCTSAIGESWPCGRVAKAALEKLLLSPGLACMAEAKDRFARSIATCSATGVPDLGGEQVRAGMAISHQSMAMRSYGAEEDEARAAKRGIWQGRFEQPADWRAARPRI